MVNTRCTQQHFGICRQAKYRQGMVFVDDITGSQYPAWEYKKDSVLRDTMVKVYTDMYGKAPEVVAIHAGLECGLFAKKIPGLDLISLGPDMHDVHTPDERLSISSTIRVWDYLKAVLKKLK